MSERCVTCGHFLSYKEMDKGGGASWVFVPDSDISYEENYWQCKKCTDKHGIIVPVQYVKKDTCSGIV